MTASKILKIGSRTNCEAKEQIVSELSEVNGCEYETYHVETTLKSLSVNINVLGRPLLGLGVEVVVSPKLGHELLLSNTELLGVLGSELTEGESPTVESGSESDGSLVGVNLNVTENGVVVGGDDNVDGFDGSGEGLVEILLGDLEFEEGTIDFVDDNDRLDPLSKGLSENGFGLDANSLDAINDDKSSIGDTESGGNLRREIDVTGGIDQVNQELST